MNVVETDFELFLKILLQKLFAFELTFADLQLEVLLEIHNQEELEKSELSNIQMVGVNNRNLKTFEVSLDTSKELSKLKNMRRVNKI